MSTEELRHKLFSAVMEVTSKLAEAEEFTNHAYVDMHVAMHRAGECTFDVAFLAKAVLGDSPHVKAIAQHLLEKPSPVGPEAFAAWFPIYLHAFAQHGMRKPDGTTHNNFRCLIGEEGSQFELVLHRVGGKTYAELLEERDARIRELEARVREFEERRQDGLEAAMKDDQ